MTDQPERKREEDTATEQWKQELMERHGLVKLAEGGPVEGPAPLIEIGGIDCVIPARRAPGGVVEPPQGHKPELIVIDLSQERVITAEQIRSDPIARAVLNRLNRVRDANQPSQD